MTNQPIQKFTIDPKIQGAIFENQQEYQQADGSRTVRTVYTAQLSRRYFDKNSSTWKETNSYSLKELLVHREVVEQAITALKELAAGKQSSHAAADEEGLRDAA